MSPFISWRNTTKNIPHMSSAAKNQKPAALPM